jgi:hypothetical protein
MWGPIFNCKWPAKVLQDLFTPRLVPDPEFKPFDLRALGSEHPSGSSSSTNPLGTPATKTDNPASSGEDSDSGGCDPDPARSFHVKMGLFSRW